MEGFTPEVYTYMPVQMTYLELINLYTDVSFQQSSYDLLLSTKVILAELFLFINMKIGCIEDEKDIGPN